MSDLEADITAVVLPEVEFTTTDESGQDEPTLDRFGRTVEEVESMSTLLVTNIRTVYNDMSGWREKVAKWRRQSEAEMEPNVRRVNRLENPSRVVQPLTQIHHQTLSANITKHFAVDPFFGFDAQQDDPTCREDATFLTHYFSLLAKSASDLNLPPTVRVINDEVSLIGRCPVKVIWSDFRWNYKRPGVNGEYEDVEMIYRQGAEIVPIQPEDFIFPPQWDNIYYMPWVGHIVHIPAHELRARAAKGEYDTEAVETVLTKGGNTELPSEQINRLSLQGISANYTDEVFDLVEVYFYDDVDGDGIAEDYVWVIDLMTGTVLYQDYNTLGARPFEMFRWIPHTYDLGGRGVGKTLEGLQEESTSIGNFRNDNMTIVGMRMLQMSAATASANTETIYPGKIWKVVGDQRIEGIQLGEVYNSSLEALNDNRQQAAQATGLSEVQRGFADPTLGQRDTFRGQSMRMGEAKGVSTTIMDGVGESWNRVQNLIMLQQIAHSAEVVEREGKIKRLTAKQLTQLERLLSLDPSEVPTRFRFTAHNADSKRSKESQLQTFQMVAALYQQWAMGAIPIAQQVFGPMGQQMQASMPDLYNTLMNVFSGSTRLLEHSMTLAGIDNAGSFLPSTKLWDFLLGMKDAMTDKQVEQLEAQNGSGFNSPEQQYIDGAGGQVESGGGGGQPTPPVTSRTTPVGGNGGNVSSPSTLQ